MKVKKLMVEIKTVSYIKQMFTRNFKKGIIFHGQAGVQTYTLTDSLELHKFYTGRMSKIITRCGPGVQCTVQEAPAHGHYLV